MTVTILLTTLSSCGGSPPATASTAELNRGTALIETDADSALLYVTVVETEEQRSIAFEETNSLDDDEGMAFLYYEPTEAPFVMEGRFPLSVAFFDLDGEVVASLDMDPCEPDAGAFPIYDPGVAYVGALAVNEGAFDRIGVEEGAVVEIVPGSE
jgi:uncharacterized membrane protein (UPF0127 family)